MLFWVGMVQGICRGVLLERAPRQIAVDVLMEDSMGSTSHEAADRRVARRFSRRSILATAGLLGVATAAAAVGTGVQAAPDNDVAHTVFGIDPLIRTERLYSAARGRDVDVVAILPPGVPHEGLPMSLLLHGLHGNARSAAVGGLAEVLAVAVAARLVPAFGFLAVDGGDSYWHQRNVNDDPMRMLTDEVPHWLSERRLGGPVGEPFACTGISMGGFGSLLYGRRRNERGRPANAIAAISPGLITSWDEMSKRNAFSSHEEWTALDPLRNIDKQGPAPTGVWVGDRDKFVEGCRQFIGAAPLEVGRISPGGHTEEYWRTITPEVVAFLGRHVR
ncbi:alpha/beta hydrolase [Nocardia sp. NPDC055321]